ncbi:MAG: hypothetical protein AAFY56_09670 [Pseudomonadota bacterium]
MTRTSDLNALLDAQHIAQDSREMRELQDHRANVESKIRSAFLGANPTIRYGGSKAKGTMIKESYDLDIIVYAKHDDTTLGDTLPEIYENVARALSRDYYVQPKTSALKLFAKQGTARGDRLYIDVVPGRFVDHSCGDAYLHQNDGQKSRLKTNLQVHIDHIKNSGLIDVLKLGKLMRVRHDLDIKQFALDLLFIELLKGRRTNSLDSQFSHVLDRFASGSALPAIEDPANPSGNDLSHMLNANIVSDLRSVATMMLEQSERASWAASFGEPDVTGPARVAVITSAAENVNAPTKPWAR